MLVSQSMITPMSADAEWRQSLRIRPPAFRLENHACAPYKSEGHLDLTS